MKMNVLLNHSSTAVQEDKLIAIMQKIYMLKNAIYKLADQLLFTPA